MGSGNSGTTPSELNPDGEDDFTTSGALAGVLGRPLTDRAGGYLEAGCYPTPEIDDPAYAGGGVAYLISDWCKCTPSWIGGSTMRPRARVLLFRALPRRMAAEVFSHLQFEQQEALLRDLTDEESRDLLAGLHPDDRTHLLAELPGKVTQQMLDLLGPEDGPGSGRKIESLGGTISDRERPEDLQQLRWKRFL